MDVAEVRSYENRLNPIGRDAGRVEELAVRRARLQDRDDRHPGPELRRELLEGSHYCGSQWRRRRARSTSLERRDLHGRIGRQLLELLPDGLGVHPWENAAIDVGACPLRQG